MTDDDLEDGGGDDVNGVSDWCSSCDDDDAWIANVDCVRLDGACGENDVNLKIGVVIAAAVIAVDC